MHLKYQLCVKSFGYHYLLKQLLGSDSSISGLKQFLAAVQQWLLKYSTDYSKLYLIGPFISEADLSVTSVLSTPLTAAFIDGFGGSLQGKENRR